MIKRKPIKDIYRLAKYRIKFDHVIEGKTYWDKDTKQDAMKLLTNKLRTFPHVKANLQILNQDRDGYKAHSSYEYRKHKKTGRLRLIKL